MGWLLLIGLFCFLLVLGAILGKEPFPFAIGSAVVLAALCFVAVVVFVIYALVHG
jgi:hypothetical protein